MFGGECEVKAMENMDYTLFKVDQQAVAGMLEMTAEWGDDIPPHWMVYFAVLDQTVPPTIRETGGTICVPLRMWLGGALCRTH